MRAAWLCVFALGCAAGGGDEDAGTGDPIDAARDGSASADGSSDDAAPDDAGPDAGRGGGRTCEACADDGDCQSGSYCAELAVGGSACLPSCMIDLPDCPPRFECVANFTESLPNPVCAPVGERCCVDFDDDQHGMGVGCMGADCNDDDMSIHASASEVCDGIDQDCDGTVDEGDPAVLCLRGEHVAESACGAAGSCEIAACEPGWGDCDMDASNGCEQSLDDPMNCGGCGDACTVANAMPGCVAGSCTVGACDRGFGDCDARPENGCETSLTSTMHCGFCGVTCGRNNAITDCSTGVCAIDSCDPNWGDCDMRDMNGCETPLVTNANCGTCGTTCAPAGGSGDCSTGTCRVSTCAPGFADCDGMDTNGCERSIRTLTDCGACGVPCGFANATASCAVGACSLETCNPGFGNCDGASGNGCETPLNTTTSCGACGTPCAPFAASGDCSSGTCRIATCDPGFADCDMRPENGCETSLRSDLNCGGCGVLCERTNGSATCATGTCRIAMCDPGFASCDSIDANGCETPLRTVTDCGGCNTPCSRLNATATCGTGTCAIATCNPGYANCDGVDSNGCETPLNTTTSCGGCGTACSRPNATADCSDGTCGVAACNAGFADCDGIDANGCETSLNTTTDCGACGRDCSRANASATCGTGTCRISMCNPGFANCDMGDANGCEQPLNTLTSCGACGATCMRSNATASCATGTCEIGSCNAGFDDCDGLDGNGCETSLRTNTNCGSCSTACTRAHATSSCSSGTCQIAMCDATWDNCDGNGVNGCETPLNTLTDCGTCGGTCARNNATATCSTGSCATMSCNSGFANCDMMDANGCETSTRTLTSCGACGVVCSPPNASGDCTTGMCRIDSCNPNFGNCDASQANGCETPLTTNMNCGACGVPCNPAGGMGDCSTGTCRVSGCGPGLDDCDMNPGNGCETNIRTLSNCGGCGIMCTRANATATCSSGACAIMSCNGGFGNCDGTDSNGCEQPLNTTSHCGGCAVSCTRANATATCGTGTCAIQSCNAGFANCDGIDANGCETDIRTLSSCGACGVMCSRPNAVADCADGTCNIGMCNGGFANCDSMDMNGCETPTTTTSNCGACGVSCTRANATATCGGGTCQILSCNAGWGNCDGNDANGCETSLTTTSNCGMCGMGCSRTNATATCGSGTCAISSCNAGFGNCDGIDANGCEQPLNTNAHCAGCGVSCTRNNATATCSTGSCQIQTCNPGFGNCDMNGANGCEQTLTTTSHCGGCGVVCARANAGESCPGGVCTLGACDAGWGNCNGIASDGCEQTLTTSTSHCGACNFACTNANGTTACVGGACDPTCAFGYQSCDGNLANGCEGPNRDTNPACSGGTAIGDGTVSGDSGAQANTITGYTEGRYRIRVTEDSSSCTYTSAQVNLISPSGVNFNMEVRCNNCSGSARTTSTGVGVTDSVITWHGDSCFGEDSGYDMFIDVRYASGGETTCGNFTLQVIGNIAATTADLCCGDC